MSRWPTQGGTNLMSDLWGSDELKDEASAANLDGVSKINGVLGKHGTRFAHASISNPGSVVHDDQTISRKVQEQLSQAARSGDFKRAVDAVADGADVMYRDVRGQDAMMFVAASSGKGTTECLKFLVQSESDLEAKDENGWTPILHACRNNRPETVKFLLDSNASIKARANDGKTCLMLATMEGADSLVMTLVKSQAQVDKKDEGGWSVLFYACRDGRKDLVRWLLDHSANAREKAKDGSTPLMVAGQDGNVKIGRMLVKKGASINAKKISGDTALMMCLKERNEEYAKWLLEDCAEVGAKNQENITAIDIADSLEMTSMKNKLEIMHRRDIQEGGDNVDIDF